MNAKKKANIEQLLIENGTSKNVARILLQFDDGIVLTQDELSRLTGLPEPAISVSLKWLEERGLVNHQARKIRDTRSRPTNFYSLDTTLRDTIASVVEERTHRSRR